MIPFNFFPSIGIGDAMLVKVDPLLALVAVALGTALVLASIWLSHRPQPVPNETAWRLSEGARRGPYRHRRGKR